MTHTTEELWRVLTQAGISNGEIPPSASLATPWYIRLLHGFGAWISAGFLTLFLAAGFDDLLENAFVAFFLACCLFTVAYVLYSKKAASDYFSQLALVASFSAQALILFHIIDANLSIEMRCWIFAALQIILVILLPNSFHRTLSTYIATLLLTYLGFNLGLENVAIAFTCVAFTIIFINESRWRHYWNFATAVGYGLIFASLTATFIMLTNIFTQDIFATTDIANHINFPSWINSGLIACVLISVVYYILKRNNANGKYFAILMTLTSLCALLTLEISGFAISLILVLLGYNNSNRVLLTLGILMSVHCVAFYYYNLNTTLLNKAFIMMTVGCLLLACRYFMYRHIKTSGESHA